MRINADFSQRVVISADDYQWVASPMAGVDRMMLDRIGDEVARATSIVRYQPNTTFSSHRHDGGEETFVLEGVFADEHGRYPAGSYIRNPVGTAHTPQIGSEGATIFVKLHQFGEGDLQQSAFDTATRPWAQGLVSGLQVLSLHQYQQEHVALVRWAPNTQFNAHRHWGGEEIFVLGGVFYDDLGRYPKGTWIRSPHGSEHTPFTGSEGALIYVKTGHLPQS